MLFASSISVFGVALGLRLFLVFAPPVFSDDIYRYIWDGRIMNEGINPYRYAPTDNELEAFRNKSWERINHPELKTIYPPLAQLYFAIVTKISHSETGFKIAASITDAFLVFFIIYLAKGRLRLKNQNEYSEHSGALFAGLIYGLNPMSIIETGMSGHLDPVAMLTMMAALVMLEREKIVSAAFFLSLGVSIKIAPILLMPLIVVKGFRVGTRIGICSILMFVCLTTIFYIPFLSAHLGLVETLDAFARRWEGNGGLFTTIEYVFRSILMKLSESNNSDVLIHIPFLDSIASYLEGTFFSLHKDGGFDPSAPGTFSIRDISLAMTKVLMTLIMGVIIIWSIRSVNSPLSISACIIGCLVLVSPIVHPWYLLWILVIAAPLGIWPWYVLSAFTVFSYLPLDKWWAQKEWSSPTWVPLVEYGMFFSSVILYYYIRSRKAGEKTFW